MSAPAARASRGAVTPASAAPAGAALPPAPIGGVSLRRLLLRAIVGAVAVAVLLFALPLAVAVDGLLRAQAVTELQREAERAVASVDGDAPTSTPLPPPRNDRVHLALYNASARLLVGNGPTDGGTVVLAALRGQETDAVVNDQLVAALVLGRPDGELLVVRAARPYSDVSSRVHIAWLVLVLLAAGILALVAVLARQQAARLARPLEGLTAAARRLGRGDFLVVVPPSRVLEINEAGTALGVTARRLGGLVERERAFSAHASHQLRTPLTGVRLRLEAALLDPQADREAAISASLDGLDRLEQTVTDLLNFARQTQRVDEELDAAALLHDAARHWQLLFDNDGRGIEVDVAPDLPQVRASSAGLRQVLDVLLDNARTHGSGTVRLSAAVAGDFLALEVSDEGAGLHGDPEVVFGRRAPDARGHGIGMGLARALAEADGGRLVVRRASPRPVFAVLLPTEPDSE